MRIQTKQQRTELRDAQFNRLIAAGYTREDYKTLQIFTNTAELLLKIFKGTSTNPLTYTRFRTIDRMQEVVKVYKDGADRSEAWKAEQKERNKGKSSSHAATAAAIKAELKAAFPNCKFSVTSDSFSGGNATRIHWTDGPTSTEVEKITGKYQYGHFDGMTDCYESSNSRDDIPQTKYVTESRSYSEGLEQEIQSQLSKLMEMEPMELEKTARRLINNTSIPHQYNNIHVRRNDQTAGTGWESFFYVEFEGAPQQEKEATQRPAAPQIAADQITVIKYSEKAIAVIGNTKPIKDALKELGGSFNPRLSCGAGWIFSAKKQEQVIEMLKGMKDKQEAVKRELKEEIQKTVDFFKETDIQIYGQVQPCTMQIVRVQKGETANV